LRRLQTDYYQALNITDFILSGSSYDAVWAMALGLHSASERPRSVAMTAVDAIIFLEN
jgi:hypothetical protein